MTDHDQDRNFSIFLKDLYFTVGQQQQLNLTLSENVSICVDLMPTESTVSLFTEYTRSDTKVCAFWQLQLTSSVIQKHMEEIMDFANGVAGFGVYFARALQGSLRIDKINNLDTLRYMPLVLKYIIEGHEIEGTLEIPLVQSDVDIRILRLIRSLAFSDFAKRAVEWKTFTGRLDASSAEDMKLHEHDSIASEETVAIAKSKPVVKRKLGGTAMFPGRKR